LPRLLGSEKKGQIQPLDFDDNIPNAAEIAAFLFRLLTFRLSALYCFTVSVLRRFYLRLYELLSVSRKRLLVFRKKNSRERKVGLQLINTIKYTMAKKLYVGGLPYSMSEDGLKEMFAEAGTVESAVIILDKMSGRSKGFGFVEMSTEEEAAKAKETFSGKEVEGRALTVEEARPMEPRAPRRDFGGDRRGGFGGSRRNSW
jgi:hypothetical protein